MSEEINQRELRNESGRIPRAAERGASFVNTRNGTPVAKLVPLENKKVFVSRSELKRSAARLPRMDFARLRADLDDLARPETSGKPHDHESLSQRPPPSEGRP